MTLWHLMIPGLSTTMQDGALATVKKAHAQFRDNSTKRAWAVEQLMTMFHVSESVARLLVELAIFLLKREGAEPKENA